MEDLWVLGCWSDKARRHLVLRESFYGPNSNLFSEENEQHIHQEGNNL